MGIWDDIKRTAGAGLTAAAGAIASSGDDRSIADWLRRSDDDVSPDMMSKALASRGMGAPTDEQPRAMFHDPYAIMDWGGWRQRPNGLTYDTLRQMATSCTPIAAIVQLRVNQISQFARPQQGQYDKGYRVVLRDRRDTKRSMSKQEQAAATDIERMLETTGWLMPNERPMDRDSFRTFVKKSTRDVLIYDSWCFEKLRDARGRPSRFICLPSETIRPAVADLEHMSVEDRRERVSHVQVYDDTVIAEFTPEDIAWCVMNPRSDLRTNGFGFSPVEQVVQLVTAWLFGFNYNQNFFKQGSAIKGLINIKGAIPDRQMRAFRRMWYGQISGVNNAFKTPILNSDDIQWVNMHSNNREMEFASWMDWLTKLVSACFAVDPSEINFAFGNTGQTSSLGTQNNEEKVTESKDKGLRPLVEHFTDHINQHLIWELNPDFEFSFVGLDAKAEGAEREARIKETSALRTIDEARAEMDLPPLPEGSGAIIRDPIWMQHWQAMQQAQGMEGEGFGEDDEGGLGMPESVGGMADEPEDDDLLQAGKPPEDDEEGDELLSQDAARDAQKALLEVATFATDRLQKAQLAQSEER